MADNVPITAGSGTTIAADEVVDATLGTVKAQFIKIMDGTLDSSNKAGVDGTAGALKVLVVDTAGTGQDPVGVVEDAAYAGGESGIPSTFVRDDAKNVRVSTDGDFGFGSLNSVGDLRVDGGQVKYVDVTLSLDTAQYQAADVLADSQIVAAVPRANDALCVLHSITLIDIDDASDEIDLVFMRTSTSLGTENSAVSISAANLAAGLIGIINIASADYVDMINAKAATKTNVGLCIDPVSGSDDIYVGAVVRSGTTTHTASGIVLRLGFIVD